MKKNPAICRVLHGPDEELIRDYARHLYEQHGRLPGHELDDWLEAEACIRDNVLAPPRKGARELRLIGYPFGAIASAVLLTAFLGMCLYGFQLTGWTDREIQHVVMAAGILALPAAFIAYRIASHYIEYKSF